MSDSTSPKILPFNFWVKFFFVALLLLGSWYYLFAGRAIVELTATSNVKSLFKIYYSDDSNHWSERNMHEAYVHPGIQKYSFRLTNLKKIKNLRIDPTEKAGEITIQALTLRQYGYQPVDVMQIIKRGDVQYKDGIVDSSFNKNGLSLSIDSDDPKIFLTLPKLQPEKETFWILFQLIALLALAWILIKIADKIVVRYRFVIFGMLIILTLAATMASISKYNTHPDEMVHYAAAKFYIENTIPPAVGDDRAEGTYSPYGFSRLYSGELAYFFAGKFAKFIEPLNIPNYLAFRYFNIVLFALLFIAACFNLTWRFLLVPIFLFPQIWYIFSYWNSDALALFFTLCSVWQLIAKESSWNQLISRKPSFSSVANGVKVVLLLAALFFCKKNFYFYLLFAGFFILHSIAFRRIPLTKGVIMILFTVLFSATTLWGGYHLWDAAQNDFAKTSRINEQVRIHAKPVYNPDTPFEEQLSSLYMKQRGVSFADMLTTRWGERTFRTSVGEYGYTSVQSPFNYYHYMRYSLILLGIAVICSILVWGNWGSKTLMLLTIGTAFALIAVSFYHSWTMDYQAQGRYLLPIIGMLSLFYCSARKQLENIVVISLSALIFCGGVYNFIFVALAGITKVSMPF